MSKATEALALRSVHNPHNLCSKFGGSVFVVYLPADSSFAGRSAAAWAVASVRGVKFDGPWYDHGAKTFMLDNRDGGLKDQRAGALDKALAFAAAQVSDHPTRWGRDPFGAWQTMDVLERAGVKAREVREVDPARELVVAEAS